MNKRCEIVECLRCIQWTACILATTTTTKIITTKIRIQSINSFILRFQLASVIQIGIAGGRLRRIYMIGFKRENVYSIWATYEHWTPHSFIADNRMHQVETGQCKQTELATQLFIFDVFHSNGLNSCFDFDGIPFVVVYMHTNLYVLYFGSFLFRLWRSHFFVLTLCISSDRMCGRTCVCVCVCSWNSA